MWRHTHICVCPLICLRVCVLKTWRLAYSVCSAYYEREDRKIRDLNYLEGAWGRTGGGRARVGWKEVGGDGGEDSEKIRKRGNAISPQTPRQMRGGWTENKAGEAGWAIAKGGEEEERDAEKDKKDSDGEKQLAGGSARGGRRRVVVGGLANHLFFPLLPYCMTQENLTVIIMEGWIIPIIEFASGTASVAVDLKKTAPPAIVGRKCYFSHSSYN